MASDKQSTNRIPDWSGGNKSTGVKLDPGPFIGIIKNNADPSRQGRLAVCGLPISAATKTTQPNGMWSGMPAHSLAVLRDSRVQMMQTVLQNHSKLTDSGQYRLT